MRKGAGVRDDRWDLVSGDSGNGTGRSGAGKGGVRLLFYGEIGEIMVLW